MVTCAWCGTTYGSFQSKCDNCGAALPPPEGAPEETEVLLAPPPPPRFLPANFVWRFLLADGWAIAASIFLIIGVTFAPLGVALTVPIVTAFVGLPFLVIGVAFLGAGAGILIWRYNDARRVEEVLRTGEAVRGQIVEVAENFHVEINGRHPWTTVYRFEWLGREYEGKVTALQPPLPGQVPGRPVYVLVAPGAPERNTIYPNPHGYLAGGAALSSRADWR